MSGAIAEAIAKVAAYRRDVLQKKENVVESAKQSKIYVGLVDIVFGIILGESFLHITTVGVPLLTLRFATLALAYGVVVSSWVGYHRSLRKQWHLMPWRFIIDLFVLFDYWVLVTFYSDFSTFLWAILALFGLYMVWGLFKAVEFENEAVRYVKRLPYVCVALALLWTYPIVSNRVSTSLIGDEVIEILYLLSVAVLVYLYWAIPPRPLGQELDPPPEQPPATSAQPTHTASA
jgi:hypothetical protein